MAYHNMFLLCLGLVLGTVQASDLAVNISNTWMQDFGWEVACSWELSTNSSLDVVALYFDFMEILTYKPEKDVTYRRFVATQPENKVTVDCANTPGGRNGICVLTIELLQPQQGNFRIGCLVKEDHSILKNVTIINAFIPPTDASVASDMIYGPTGRVKLNCTSSGLLRPTLTWTLGDQKVPQDSEGGAWNSTSKLWDVWSVYSYLPSKEHYALCTPETRVKNLGVKGRAASSAPWIIFESIKRNSRNYIQGPEIHVECG